jgi:hypothetical protein
MDYTRRCTHKIRPEFFYSESVAALPAEIWRDRQLAQLLNKAFSNVRYFDVEAVDFTPALTAAFEFHPDIRELLFPLALTMLESDQTTIETLRFLPESAFSTAVGDTERTRAACAVLSIARSGNATGARHILDTSDWDKEGPYILALCQKLLEGEILPLQHRLLVLSDVIKRTNKGGDGNWRMFVEALHRALDTRKSGLLLRTTWVEKLKLPEDSFPILLPTADIA